MRRDPIVGPRRELRAADVHDLERGGSGRARRERVLHVKRIPRRIARSGDDEHGRPAAAADERVAHVVGGNAVGIVDRDRGDAAARRAREGRLARLVRAERHARIARGPAVDRQAQPRVARARAAVVHAGDDAIRQRTHVGDREVRRERADIHDLDRGALGHRHAIAGVPPVLLQVGDDHDRAAAAGKLLRRRRERGAVARRAEAGRRLVDRRRRQHAIGPRLHHDLRLVVEGDDADEIAGRRARDRVLRQLARALEAPGRRHAVRRVERDDGDAGRGRRGAAREERTREGEREEDERGDAQREQDQLAQVAPLRVLDGRLLQQLDRREPHALLRLALEQMQHDRDGRRGGAREEDRREEAHSALDLVDRYESSASSSGRLVSSSW